MISVRWENMLGRYIFLYQLEILQEEAEISKFKNITLSSALPPHIRRRSCKGVFHIAQIPATSNKCVSYPVRPCWTLAGESQSLPRHRYHTLYQVEIQVEACGQRGKCFFSQHPTMNIKIINIFLLHSDIFSCSKDNSSSIFWLHYVYARHHCSHKSKWKSDCFGWLTYPQTRDGFKVLKATGF